MRAELLELLENRKLLEEHQPILEDREKGLDAEFKKLIPELEHFVVNCSHSFRMSKKRIIQVMRKYGTTIVDRAVPAPTVSLDTGKEIRLVLDSPDYSTTMTDADVDLAIEEFREVLGGIVQIAKVQANMMEIKEELGDVRRTNNAIKHSLLPQIEEQIVEIQNKMEDEEADERIRLKFFIPG